MSTNVSDRLFLTNNHVITAATQASQFVLEFDDELDAGGRRRDVTRCSLDPETFFLTDGPRRRFSSKGSANTELSG